jgi:tRNA 2-thiouridine synthesizing protein A
MMGLTKMAATEKEPKTIRTICLDLRGLPNPEPVLELAEEAEKLAPGEMLEVIADDPCAQTDFLHWLAGSDFELINLRYLPDKENKYLLRRSQE